MINAHIYCVTNKVSGKQYVGQTIHNDKVGHGMAISEAYKKYGKEAFEYEKICTGIDNKNTLNYLERFWIATHNSIAPNGYNIETGGTGKGKTAESTKAKISKSLMGNIPWNKGKPMSEEIKLKLSLSKKGIPSGRRGIPHSAETKIKLSNLLKGRLAWNKGLLTPSEVRVKQSLAKIGTIGNRIGKKNSPEHIAKMKATKALQPYILSETGREAIKKANTGRIHEIVTCHHCGTSGGITAMPRWHFDNCRNKGINI